MPDSTSLMQSPERFAIELKREPGAKTLTLVAKLKDEKGPIRVEAGNGVENSWRGYFSHGARETSIVVDAERLVPLEEQTGGTTVRYSDWQDVGPGKWVPRRIDVLSGSTHYRMNFAWLGDAVWLLRSSESITPEATVPLTRTRNVIANGRHVSAPVTDAENRSQEARAGDRLDARPQPPVARRRADRRRLAAALQDPRRTRSIPCGEDVRETAEVDRGGEVVVEVAHDGQGKMKDRLGDREIALNTREYASSRRGARFARIHGRPERERDQPFDLALKHYARIGCQLDLPLFRYRERARFGRDHGEGRNLARPALPGRHRRRSPAEACTSAAGRCSPSRHGPTSITSVRARKSSTSTPTARCRSTRR